MTQFVFLISFLMAFLLFAVQPMATKMVLPYFGGTPAVWNTAMLTFQLLLLAGYGYAHALSKFAPSRQRITHGALILISLGVLPLAIPLNPDTQLLDQPIRHLTLAFVLHLGAPFFALSATAPLLQSWVSRSAHPLAQKPYVLYSASNLGSLMALVGYVVCIEPYFTLPQQSLWWSALYVAGAAALLLAGWKLPLAATAATATPVADEQVGRSRVALWVFLAFLSSALCLSVTSFITTDLAAVPLLWIVPLSIYLLSFVDAFRERPIFIRFAQRGAPLCGVAALILYAMQHINLAMQFLVHVLFFVVLVFGINGWLAQLRPKASQLTRFYFCMSIGGALGGVFNALIAPVVFTEIIEYPLTLLAASLTLFLLLQQRDDPEFSLRKQMVAMGMVIGLMLVIAFNTYLVGMKILKDDWLMPWHKPDYQLMLRSVCFAAIMTLVLQRRYVNAFYGCVLVCAMILFALSKKDADQTVFKERNFFGVVRVDLAGKRRLLFHNTTMHSFQLLKEEHRLVPTTYYAHLGQLFALPAVVNRPYAVIGLGAGTMKCYAKRDQRAEFFEINPVVLKVAEGSEHFTFLKDCMGDHQIHLGDGRLMLDRQQDGKYGLIALDAFSSDAIPAHLLTREAFGIYLKKLAPHGVIIVHITNRYLHLSPLMAAQAKAVGMVVYERNWGDSRWVVFAREASDLTDLRAVDDRWTLLTPMAQDRPWTDNYTNLVPYFISSQPHLKMIVKATFFGQ